jgi:putative membrane protein
MIVKGSGNRVSIYPAMILLAMIMALLQRGWGATDGLQSPALNAPTLPGKGVAGPVTDVQHSFADQAFVKSVLERDSGDLQLGQLAQQKSQSDDVKQLGQKIVATRTAMDGQFKLIAQSLSVSEPKGPSKKDKQFIARLEGLSGAQFDEEFIKALVRIHRQDIKDFQVEAQTAQEPSVLQAARQDGSSLSQELQEIQAVAQAHNVTIDEKK